MNMVGLVCCMIPALYGNLCQYAEVGWPHITRPLSVNMLRWVGRISPDLYGNLCKYAEVGWPHITRPLWKLL